MSITAGAHVAKVEMKPSSLPEGAAVTFDVAGRDLAPFQCRVLIDKALSAGEAEQKARRTLRQFAKELADNLGKLD